MKKFHFHLQKVLDLKEKETEQAKWAFGKSVQRKIEEETKLFQLTERREKITLYLQQVQNRVCSAAELIDITRFRQAIDHAINVQQNTLYGCEQEMEKCKQRLTVRMQESQLWQRLREKAEEQFNAQEKLREQKELDEIGINRYFSQQQAKGR
jgi:flagellar FliJ protein